MKMMMMAANVCANALGKIGQHFGCSEIKSVHKESLFVSEDLFARLYVFHFTFYPLYFFFMFHSVILAIQEVPFEHACVRVRICFINST